MKIRRGGVGIVVMRGALAVGFFGGEVGKLKSVIATWIGPELPTPGKQNAAGGPSTGKK